MAQQIVKEIIRLFSIITGTVILLPFLSLSPVLAESLVSSPNITELEMLPGTTARIVLSVENRADTSHAFHLTLDQITNLRINAWMAP